MSSTWPSQALTEQSCALVRPERPCRARTRHRSFWLDAAIPGVFMYVTTTLAALVTARNLYATVFTKSLGKAGKEVAVFGSGVTILIALLIVVAAIFIAYDGIRAFQRYRKTP